MLDFSHQQDIDRQPSKSIREKAALHFDRDIHRRQSFCGEI